MIQIALQAQRGRKLLRLVAKEHEDWLKNVDCRIRELNAERAVLLAKKLDAEIMQGQPKSTGADQDAEQRHSV